jgi:ERCC4-type nuclease
LEYGDLAFLGNGENKGEFLSVGIERKTLPDFISSFNTGRLTGHQLPGLLSTYDVIYLVIEGIWRINPESGYVEMAHRGSKWDLLTVDKKVYDGRTIFGVINTLMIRCNVKVWKTSNSKETVKFVQCLYHWWADKLLSEHASHLKPYLPVVDLKMCTPSLVYRVARELPGIGDLKAKQIVKKFKTVANLVMADVSDWEKIEGIGKTLANRIIEKLHDEHKELI